MPLSRFHSPSAALKRGGPGEGGRLEEFPPRDNPARFSREIFLANGSVSISLPAAILAGMTVQTHRRCTRCGECLPAEAFRHNPKLKSGLHSRVSHAALPERGNGERRIRITSRSTTARGAKRPKTRFRAAVVITRLLPAGVPRPDQRGSRRDELFDSHTGLECGLALPLMEFQVVESETDSEPR
jgi:hypothetical protein